MCWCMIETLSVPSRKSSEIFDNLRKMSEKMFENVRLIFEKILENLRKLVGNLQKIFQNFVISMFM